MAFVAFNSFQKIVGNKKRTAGGGGGGEERAWVAVGNGSTTALAYSNNGVNWTALPNTVMTTGKEVAYGYSGTQGLWVVTTGVATGNSMCYSTNAINWTGIPGSATNFPSRVSVTYSAKKYLWLSGGDTAPYLAYSTDAYNWTTISSTAIAATPLHITDNSYNNYLLLAISTGSGNSVAYSSDGFTWTGSGNPLGTNSFCIASNATMNIVVSYFTTNFSYSSNGIAWTTVTPATSGVSMNGYFVTYGKNAGQDVWLRATYGVGGNAISYSSNGLAWTGLGNPYGANNNVQYGIAYSAFQNMWVSTGSSGMGNTLAYSSNGITWTGLGTNIFNANSIGVASIK